MSLKSRRKRITDVHPHIPHDSKDDSSTHPISPNHSHRRKSQTSLLWIKLFLGIPALTFLITSSILYSFISKDEKKSTTGLREARPKNRFVPPDKKKSTVGIQEDRPKNRFVPQELKRAALQQNQQQQEQQAPEKLYLGSEYTNPTILSQNCSLTILILDPTLASSPKAYTALESVSANIIPPETTCFLLQTSICRFRTNRTHVYQQIQSRAKPHFKQFIKRGNVRVSIIDYRKYHLRSCFNFYSPSNAWMMATYWDDEFNAQDSDLILSIQDDAVLCHTLDPNLWRGFAYVGAPWPPNANLHRNPYPKEGCCRYVTETWANWTKHQTPPINVCRDGLAPVGNGGLTLRSRFWMKKAIDTCPHSYNEFWNSTNNTLCELMDVDAVVPEDLYFATILRGIDAPMPNAFEASLFSAEMILPEMVLRYYGLPKENRGGVMMMKEMEQIVSQRWASLKDGLSGVELFRRMKQKYNRTIPIGFHKPWIYMDVKMLLSEQFEQECPYLKDIIPNKDKTLTLFE